jgi:hypothetical protein
VVYGRASPLRITHRVHDSRVGFSLSRRPRKLGWSDALGGGGRCPNNGDRISRLGRIIV